MPEVKKVGLTD